MPRHERVWKADPACGTEGVRMSDSQQRDLTVERYAEATLPTQFGAFRVVVYRELGADKEHLAVIAGEVDGAEDLLARVHSECLTGEVLHSLKCDCRDQLNLALERIQAEGRGVVLYLRQEGRGIGLGNKIRAYAKQDEGLDTVEANLALGFKADMRDYGIGIQILKDLGLSRVRLLTNNPKKTDAFIYGGFDLEVVDQIPIMPPMNEHNVAYLAAKRDKLGHHLPKDA